MSEKTATVEEMKAEWLARLHSLVAQIEQWARDRDWSTRRIEKRMEDSILGVYQAPALLLQQDVVRLFLEPISHSTPGSEGAVDLYLMPAYDDIASIYFADGGWHVHYVFEDSPPAAKFDKSMTQPLSQETFESILKSMKIHAGSIA